MPRKAAWGMRLFTYVLWPALFSTIAHDNIGILRYYAITYDSISHLSKIFNNKGIQKLKLTLGQRFTKIKTLQFWSLTGTFPMKKYASRENCKSRARWISTQKSKSHLAMVQEVISNGYPMGIQRVKIICSQYSLGMDDIEQIRWLYGKIQSTIRALACQVCSSCLWIGPPLYQTSICVTKRRGYEQDPSVIISAHHLCV